MTKQEFLDKMTEIGTCNDDVQRRTLLTSVTDEVSKTFDEHTTYKDQNEKYQKDMEDLRSANMELFLQVGKNRQSETPIDNNGNNKPSDNLTYENLFNEKGELK